MSVSDKVLETQLNVPLHHINGLPADTLCVVRNKQSTQRLASPYDLNAQELKSQQLSNPLVSSLLGDMMVLTDSQGNVTFVI